MRDRVRRWLASRWIGLVAAVLALALTLPSLANGLSIDDHLYRARVVGDGWSMRETLDDLFMYANPERPARVKEAMTRGELSWWAAPNLRWRYFRPFAQLSHYAEFRAFGRGGATWMHLHSVLWMGLLAFSVAALYRRMFGATWIAGLAAILYAIDDGHGFTVGWLANRCGLMGAVGAAVTLYVHDKWRRDAWKPGALVGPLLLGITLFASEEAIAACGLLGAHAFVMEDTWKKRFAVIAPYIAVTFAWYASWHLMGYGIDGTGSYTDPVKNTATFVSQFAQRVPINIISQTGPLPADLWEVYFVRHDLTWVMVLAGCAWIALLAYALHRLVREDRVARFWALAFCFSLAFVCGAHPTDRHLLVVGMAGTALVARFLAAWITRELAPRGSTIIAVLLVIVHVVAAPVLLPVRARIPGSVSRGVQRIDALVPADPALAQQDLVLVNVPFKYTCNFASVVRRSNGGISPKRWRCLGVSPNAVEVSRPDERTLLLRPDQGYLLHFEDTNVRSRTIPFAAGDQVVLDDYTITIREVTSDGRPAVVEHRFAVSLDDPSLRWLVWQKGAYRPFTPPPVGSTITLPADYFAFGELLEDK